jgi:diguanylate cyclase (GGDEF)-like protein/PAS domain S-box-containing protein
MTMTSRLLEDFVEVSCDWFWEMDAELKFSYFSRRWERVFGFSPQGEIGKSRLEVAQNSSDQALWQPHIADLLARRPFRDLTYPYGHRDGSTRWLRVSGQPLFSSDGKFTGYRGVGTDVTAQHEADELLAQALKQLQQANVQLAEQNLLFDTALNTMSHGLCMWDEQLDIIVCNKRFLEIYGFSPDAVKPGVGLREVMLHSIAIGNHPGSSIDELYEQYVGELTKQGSLTMQRDLSGGRTIAISHRPMSNGGWVATYEEITERKQHLQALQEREEELHIQNERFDAALNNMGSGLAMFDADFKLIVCNNRYAEMYGISPSLLKPGTSLRSILESRVRSGCFSGNDPREFVRRGLASAKEKASDTVELRDGRVFSIVRHRLPDLGWVTTHSDVTEQKRAEALVRHMAHHDALTGLPNRLLFRERMDHELERVRWDSNLAVVFLDLDGFKGVNDALGHAVGDALLKAVTERLVNCIGEAGIVARLGGDEFAILQVTKQGRDEAAGLADLLLKSIGAPYVVEGHELIIGTSIGIAFSPSDGTDPHELLKKADLALYRSKSDGRGVFRFFSPDMETDRNKRQMLEGDLQGALAAYQFELFYQPVVNIASGLVTSCEALLRWHHPLRGLVLPSDFIALAEETGLIGPIGEWVLHQACKEASTWPPEIKVAVNLSPVQFKRRNLVEVVIQALASSGLAANRLELEVTESVLMVEDEGAFATLHRLRALGVRVSVDDFGVGYSSLSYLRRFQFDKIKIDRSFIQDFSERGGESAVIINAIANLGAKLGMPTTAEGVETEQQLARVRAQGCTEVQGYYFFRPKPANEISELFAATSFRIGNVA